MELDTKAKQIRRARQLFTAVLNHRIYDEVLDLRAHGWDENIIKYGLKNALRDQVHRLDCIDRDQKINI
jgi:hypothetical protein